MILTLRTLLALLTLLPNISASGQDAFDATALSKRLSALDLLKSSEVPQIASSVKIEPLVSDTMTILEKFLDFIDYSAIDAFDMGAELRNETLEADVKTAISVLEEKLGYFVTQGLEASTPEGIKFLFDCFAKQGNDISAIVNTKDLGKLIMQRFDSAAAVMTLGFLDDCKLDITSIVKTALATHAYNLLRILQSCYVWPSPEQFHWFLAISYKSKWYDPHLWHTHSMDWGKNLSAICKADNSALLRDISPPFDMDTLFDSIAKHDSLNVCQYLNHELTSAHLVARLEILAKAGSFKLLRHLTDLKSIDLRLGDYPPPKKLPDDFEFFWIQGYRHLPASHFLSMACKSGRVDILEFFYKLNPITLRPKEPHLNSAAKNGHSNVLEWALDHHAPFERPYVAKILLFNGHLEGFKQLQGKLKLKIIDKLDLANSAANRNELKVVRWLYDEFEVLPQVYALSKAGVEVLEWMETIDPRRINKDLAICANLSSLKWLSVKYPSLLTDDVKDAQNRELIDLEKAKWMSSQGWKVVPDMWKAAYHNKMDVLVFGYNDLQIVPVKRHAEAAALNGHTEILKLIYGLDPSCIDKEVFSKAVENSHLESAIYLESILNLKGTDLELDLYSAFCRGKLELIEWIYQYYTLDVFGSGWLNGAINGGQLHIVKWALDKKFVLETDEKYLEMAAKRGQYLIFQRLVDYGIVITKPKDLLKMAFKRGSLDIVKCLVAMDSNNAQVLTSENIGIDNFHIIQWLQDSNFLVQ